MGINNWKKFTLLEAQKGFTKVDTIKRIKERPFVAESDETRQDIEDFFIPILDSFPELKLELGIANVFVKHGNRQMHGLGKELTELTPLDEIVRLRYFVYISGEIRDQRFSEDQVLKIFEKIKRSTRYELDDYSIGIQRTLKRKKGTAAHIGFLTDHTADISYENSEFQNVHINLYIWDKAKIQFDAKEVTISKELEKNNYKYTYTNLGPEYAKYSTFKFPQARGRKWWNGDIEQTASILKAMLAEHSSLSKLLELKPLELFDEKLTHPGIRGAFADPNQRLIVTDIIDNFDSMKLPPGIDDFDLTKMVARAEPIQKNGYVLEFRVTSCKPDLENKFLHSKVFLKN